MSVENEIQIEYEDQILTSNKTKEMPKVKERLTRKKEKTSKQIPIAECDVGTILLRTKSGDKGKIEAILSGKQGTKAYKIVYFNEHVRFEIITQEILDMLIYEGKMVYSQED